MKYTIFLFLLIVSLSGLSQPSPQDRYPGRIKAITEQLKTDPLNYKLIWERLEMKVNLMGSFPPSSEIFSFQADSFKMKKREQYFDEFNADFEKIYDNIIQLKHFEIIEEGDFYLNRTWFYFNMLEFNKAIEDAKYLRDFASYSIYEGRGDYYNDWALFSLYNLYILTQQYENALNAVNTMLDKKKNKDPKIYYSAHGSFLSYQNKILLFEYFRKENKIIPFLKQELSEHVRWYLEKAKLKNAEYESWYLDENEYYTSKSSYLYYMGSAKENSFQLLKLIIEYMRKYNDKELSGFEKVYNGIRYQMNENYETIHPNISDEELKQLILGILE